MNYRASPINHNGKNQTCDQKVPIPGGALVCIQGAKALTAAVNIQHVNEQDPYVNTFQRVQVPYALKDGNIHI